MWKKENFAVVQSGDGFLLLDNEFIYPTTV